MPALKPLITAANRFLGKSLGESIRAAGVRWEVQGFDNLRRPGSESNRMALRELEVRFHLGDLRCQSAVDAPPEVD